MASLSVTAAAAVADSAAAASTALGGRGGNHDSQHFHTTPCSLHTLPAHLFQLVLQHLTLAEQLCHSLPACKQLPCPTPVSIRHATIPITEDTAWHFRRSPRLERLIWSATSIDVLLDSAPHVSRALQQLLTPPAVTGVVHFPRLARFSCRIGQRAFDDQSPESVSSLLPFLMTRSSTLRSLHIDANTYHDYAVPRPPGQLSALLAALPSLRRLCLASITITAETIEQLLSLPLEVLDLCESEFVGHEDLAPPPQTSGSERALMRTCCVLRLPIPVNGGAELLDGIICSREDSAHPHTLTVRHYVSSNTVRHLLSMPPKRNLAVEVGEGSASFMSHSAALPQSAALPRRLHLNMWFDLPGWCYQLTRVVDSLERLRLCLRSLTMNGLPESPELIRAVLSAVSHCVMLESLSLSAVERPETTTSSESLPTATWSQQPRLVRLRALALELYRASELDARMFLSLCPSLQQCFLTPPMVNVDMLSALTTSCPLLTRLQLRVDKYSPLATSPTQAEGAQQCPESGTFHSLLELFIVSPDVDWQLPDVRYFPDILSGLHPFLAGSPTHEVTLSVQYQCDYLAPLLRLLSVLPRLQRLRIQSATTMNQRIEFASAPVAAWDDTAEVGEEEAEKQSTQDATAAILPSSDPSSPHAGALMSSQHGSSLQSLDVIIMPSLLPVSGLDLLLAHCPRLRSIRLTIRAAHRHFLILLQCLACIGKHCALIEEVTYSLESEKEEGAPDEPHTPPMWEVRQMVDQMFLPGISFARLRHVQEALQPAVPCSSDLRVVITENTSAYIRQHWMSDASRDLVLDWPTAP